MRTTLKPLLVPLVLAIGLAGLLIARSGIAQYNSWCDNPLPTPSPTPVPTPPPKCEPKECDKCTKSPCYVSTGTYVTDSTDLAVKTIGFPLVIDRHYQSSLAIDGPLGVGWTSSITPRIYYALYLFAAPATYQKQAYVIMPTGARYKFTDAGGGNFAPPQGRHDMLVRNADGTFDLTLQRTRSVMHFSVSGALETMKDDYGNTITWTFDGNGRVQRIADSAGSGRYVDITWGPDGRISSARDSAGRLVQYRFDASGNLSTVTDVANRVTTYGYVQGRFVRILNRVTDNWGRTITDITYDATDRVKTYTDKGELFTYSYAYSGNAATTAKTDSQGSSFIYPFGGDGLVSDTTPPSGGGGPTHTDYYPDGSIQQFIDAVGVRTFYTYTTGGNPLTVTRDYQGPNAVRFEYAYDPNFPAKVTSIAPKNPSTNQIDPNWQAWQYDYWQTGDPAPGAVHHVYRVHGDGVTLDTLDTYSYDPHGRVTQAVSPTGGVTDYAYDAQGNLVTETSPANNDAEMRPITTYGYDSLGRLTSASDPLGNATVFVYDSLDRVTSITLPKPSPASALTFTASYSYDGFESGSGVVFNTFTDPNGRQSKRGYDPYHRLVKRVNALGNATTYGYMRGLLTSVSDANGYVTSYAYDSGRRLTSTTFPDGAVERYTYTPDNSIYQKTDRKNQTITYGYDHFKRLASKGYPNSTGITYSYQGQNLVQVVDSSVAPTETHTFGYDSSYRIQSETQSLRGTITRVYNTDDGVASYSIQGGPTAMYSYYRDGSLNTITWSPVAGNFKYSYTLTGRYQTISSPSGQTRHFAYDDQGRLAFLSNLNWSTSNLATYAYGYDLDYSTGTYTMLGQRTSMTATVPSQGLANQQTNYEYDSNYQLIKTTYPTVAPFNGEVDTWAYDTVGNRLTNRVNGSGTNYTYQKIGPNVNNWQRLLSDGVNSYAYDANGSAVSQNGPSGNFSLTWDAENRMASIAGGATAAYLYDFQGRRTAKNSGLATSNLYDGLNLVREAGGSSADYLFGPGIDEPLAMSRGGQVYYYGEDGIGSVTTLTDSAGGVRNNYLYDVWGLAKNQSEAVANPFTYTAREKSEAGTFFLRARYMSPATGRLLAEDPLRVSQPSLVVALYPYGNSSPAMFTDPTGLESCTTNIAYGSWELASADRWNDTDWQPAGDMTDGPEEGPPNYAPPQGNATRPPGQTGNGPGIPFAPQRCHWMKWAHFTELYRRGMTISVHCECPPRTQVIHEWNFWTKSHKSPIGETWTYGGNLLQVFMRPCPRPGENWNRPIGFFAD